MAEAPRRSGPLEQLADLIELAGSDGRRGVRLRELPFPAQVNLRVDAPNAHVAEALGFALPIEPNTVAGDQDRAALWLGPDEWLILAPARTERAVEQALRDAIASVHGSVVDVSANRALLELEGPMAREVLSKGCSLDLHPRRFRAGRCAQTALARAQIILWQVTDEPRYRILVRCSFAPYLAEWLLDAMAEYRGPPPDSIAA
jgi:sarcosine oxidase, subunit gamma